MMSNVDFEKESVEFKSSCSIDDAIAKMLGWLKGSAYLVNLLIEKDGISEEKLMKLDSLVYPLNEHLEELLQSAKDKELEVYESPSSTEEDQLRASDLVLERQEQISKANIYKLSIEEELAKGDSSELIIDHEQTEKTGEKHIKIISLDRWARKYHNAQILEGAEVLIDASKAPHKAQRQDVLAEQLEPILNKLLMPTATKVMVELTNMIGKPNSCIITNVGDGVQWENHAGVVKTLTIKALEKRISRWKKDAKNPR